MGHNFDLSIDNLVNMYILCLLQVLFTYFVKNQKNWKIKKTVKGPKRIIKGLRKNKIPQKKNE